MQNHIKISIVITNYNGKELLSKNIPILIKVMDAYPIEYEIIIVDDASTDGSQEFIEDTWPKINLIKLKKNQGFPVAANYGIKKAKYDKVLLLNSDIKVKQDFLSYPLGYFTDEKTFAVSNKALKDDGSPLTRPFVIEFKYGFLRERYISSKEDPCFSFGASGGHAIFDRNKFLELGGFDEIYTPFYYEDADISYRAWKRGYRLYYEPRSIVYHTGKATIGKINKTIVKMISYRNKLLFTWKNITDKDLLLQHILFLPVHLLLNLIREPIFIVSFFWAITKLNKVFKARKRERFYIRFKDKEIINLISKNLR